MKKLLIYQWLLLVTLGLSLLVSCGEGNKKVLDKRVTLNTRDKSPYGTWYAHENLEHIFPDASVEARTEESISSGAHSRQAFIAISRSITPTTEEAAYLNSFISEGGHVFLSAFRFNGEILDSLHVEMASNFFTEQRGLSVASPVSTKTDSFAYPGMPFEEYFSKYDTSITTVLGRNADGLPNFLQFTFKSGGSVYLHCAPQALSNFFLLHKNNKKYYDDVLSHLPDNITTIYWDEYFRTHRRNQQKDFSALNWILGQASLSYALWLLLLLALLVYLFESKRKQRVIPFRPPLKNATVEFARTVGRLYLQKKNNNNLAFKMAAIFMDHVRRKFNVRTTMDDEFVEKLSHKSGYNKELLANLLYQLKYAQAHEGVSDMELLELQQLLDHFYQHT